MGGSTQGSEMQSESDAEAPQQIGRQTGIEGQAGAILPGIFSVVGGPISSWLCASSRAAAVLGAAWRGPAGIGKGGE